MTRKLKGLELALSSEKQLSSLKVCIASQAAIGQTETFIKAHLEQLPHRIEHIYGYWLDYMRDGASLRELYTKKESTIWTRSLNLLPQFLIWRIKKRWFNPVTDLDIVVNFFKSQEFDVVLAEYGTTGAFITPACKKAGIPLVVHFHGFDATRFDVVEKFSSSYKEMFHYASSVIVVSKKMYCDLLKLGCPEKKLVLNPYGPNPSFFDVKPDYGSNKVLAIGRLTEKKAPYLTLLAFHEVLKTCPDLKLEIIGDGELVGVCQDLILALSLSKHVRMVGLANVEEVRSAMNKAFMFVQHSVQANNGDCEGTPVAILEACAAGLPVVATEHAGIPDIVLHNQTGVLVEEKDIYAMAQGIVEIASDRAKAQQFGEKAKQLVEQKFNLTRHIDQLSKELISTRKAKIL